MTVRTLSIMAQYRGALLSSVRRRVRPPIDPADIVQEALARALPAIEAGHVENVQAYIHGIARNLSAEAMRQHARWSRWLVHDSGANEIADPTPSAEAHVVARDRLARLWRAADELPPRCREVFAMRHREMLDKTEIAQRLGISVKQVEKQLRHALVLCARNLDGQ